MATEPADHSTTDEKGIRRRWASPLAIVLLTLLVASEFLPTWSQGMGSHVPALSVFGGQTDISQRQKMWNVTTRADTTYAAWLVSRNAYTLLHRPAELFDAEHCAPMEKSLALGEPMLTLGVLAVPVYALTRDPIVTFNATLFTVWWVGALAVYAAVFGWTRNPVAGFVAAAIYTFHPAHARDVTHPFIYDMAWTALALLFSQRLFARGRWRDALGLSLCLVAQMGASFYPLIAALFVALPFGIWLVACYGVRRVGWSRWLMVLLITAMGALAIYGPYLELRQGTGLLERTNHNYSPWLAFLPGGLRFPGWLPLGLIVLGLVAGRRQLRDRIGGDPRWALLAGGVLVALAATGGNQVAQQLALFSGSPPPRLPNLYAIFSSVLPGFDAVRNVSQVALGVHLVVSLLAGLGVAVLWRWMVDRKRGVALGLVLAAIVVVDAVRPPGLPQRTHWDEIEIRPTDAAIDFYAELERQGNTGPMVEVPMPPSVMYRFGRALQQILLSAWHHRRTSACFGSYKSPEQERVILAAAALPEVDAVQSLGEMGFTTIVAHQPKGGALRRALEKEAQLGRLRRVHTTPSRAAYAIVRLP